MEKEVKCKDGDLEFVVKIVRPNKKILNQARLVYNKTFNEAVIQGSCFAEKMNVHLKEQGLWDDKKDAKYKETVNKINSLVNTLEEGGISLKKGKEIALEIRKARDELQDMIMSTQKFKDNCAEGVATDAQFDYLVSACSYRDNNLIWPTVDDYYADSEKEWAEQVAAELANIIYGLDPNFEQNLPENKFLVKYKLVDKDLNFVNKDGHRTDRDGRLIDEKGRYIKYDEEGNVIFININGKEVDEDGNLKVKTMPFLDDDGNPIEV